MTKKELREKYKYLRSELSEGERDQKSLSIANNLLNIPVWDKNYFHLFLPIVEMHEIDTEYILHLLSGKDKNIVISKSDFETREMQHFLLTDNTTIRKNKYNIPEPVDGIEVPVFKIDAVFVPLLAFDASGNRVGYGKGFYDKFLAGCKPGTVKIGLSYFEAEPVCTDIFEGDVRLDFCVTPETVYTF